MTARETYLALNALKWRGMRFLDRLAMRLDDLDVLLHGDAEALAEIEDFREPSRTKWLAGRGAFDLDAHLAELARHGLAVTTPADEDWPGLLRGLVDAPLALYYRGTLPRPGDVAIALVGTRGPSASGLLTARSMARDLARAGVLIASGLAQGIDGAAHHGALDVEGARTIAVLAAGAHVCYPPGHRALYERIRERGCVISEVPPGVPMERWLFPLRNRIISGLSEATVVIEAPLTSGALHTATHAAHQGRLAFAVPGPVGAAACAGTNKLLFDGVDAVRSAADVLHRLEYSVEPADPPDGTGEALRGDAAQVVALLGAEPVHVDVLLQRTGLAPGALYRLLLDLQATGVVSRVAGNRWMRGVPGARLGECVTLSGESDLYFIQTGGGPVGGDTSCGIAHWMCS